MLRWISWGRLGDGHWNEVTVGNAASLESWWQQQADNIYYSISITDSMTERVTATTILNPHTAHRQSKVESTTGGDAAGNEVKNTTEKKRT